MKKVVIFVFSIFLTSCSNNYKEAELVSIDHKGNKVYVFDEGGTKTYFVQNNSANSSNLRVDSKVINEKSTFMNVMINGRKKQIDKLSFVDIERADTIPPIHKRRHIIGFMGADLVSTDSIYFFDCGEEYDPYYIAAKKNPLGTTLKNIYDSTPETGFYLHFFKSDSSSYNPSYSNAVGLDDHNDTVRAIEINLGSGINNYLIAKDASFNVYHIHFDDVDEQVIQIH